jgi:hypothetical protein
MGKKKPFIKLGKDGNTKYFKMFVERLLILKTKRSLR